MKATHNVRRSLTQATFVCLCGSLAGWQQTVGQDRLPSAELSEETQQIRSELRDVGLRLQRLAKKVETNDPEDAKRMIEAADRIHSSDLGRVLDDISSLLGKSNFIEALGRQDRALEELDAILRILERTQFERPEDLEKKAEELKAVLQATQDATKQQQGLLQKTKDFLDRLKALGTLKDLKSDLAQLQKAQAALNQGADPDKVDPGASAADEKALEEARQTAERLRSEQERLNQQLSKLGGKNLPIKDLKELKEKLDSLLEQGEKVAQDAEAAERSEAELKSLAETSRARPDTGAKRAARTGSKTEEAKEGASKKSPDSPTTSGSEGKQSESPAEAKSAGEAVSGEKSPQEKSGGDKANSDKSSADKSGGDKSAGDKSAGGKQGGEKEATPKSNGVKNPGEPPGTKGSEPAQGPSDVELARRAQEARETKEKLSAEAKQFASRVGDLSKELGKEDSAPKGSQESVAKSAQRADSAAQDVEKGAFQKGAEAERGALEDLKKARDQVAAQLAQAEEKNNAETSGLLQDQGLLEKRTQEAASKTSQSASESSSQQSRSALEQGSESMTEASKAMQEAGQAAQGGDRQKAQASGEKAKQALEKAEAALQKGQKDLAKRTAQEKAADLQKKLAKKTEDAQKRAEELQKKLKKKDDEARGSKLGDTQGSLSKAAGSMKEAAQAQEKGQNELAKKAGEEALAELQKAQAGVEDAERDELARLEKEKLKKNAKEQEQLAQLTKELAKKAKSAAQDSQSGDSSEQLDQASESMDQAAQELDKEEGESAQKKQEEALAKLKNTRDQLREEEERLAQLKREQEMISLVDSLTQVKESQEKVNTETLRIDGGREEKESRRQRLRVQQEVEKLVTRQGDLADQVDALNQKLKEEYARVFTFVLKNVSVDMRQVTELLKQLETGSDTQFLEKEILGDVERLIAALRAEMEKKDQEEQPPGGQMPMGKPRLLPTVAELRMLKDMQVTVNRSTRDLEDRRKASDKGVSDSWKQALDRLLQKQGSVSKMTQQLMKDFKDAKESAAQGDEEEKADTDEHGHDHGH